MKVQRLVLCAILGALLWSARLPGRAGTGGDWQKAVTLDTGQPESHAQSESDPNERMEKLEFDCAIATNELVSYDRFLEKYPNSSYVGQVKRRREEKLSVLRALAVRAVFLRIDQVAQVETDPRERLAKRFRESGLRVVGCEIEADIIVSIYKIKATLIRTPKVKCANVGPANNWLWADYCSAVSVSHRSGGRIWDNRICEQERFQTLSQEGRQALIQKVTSRVADLIVKYFGQHAATPSP
jgi:hypothetical protein